MVLARQLRILETNVEVKFGEQVGIYLPKLPSLFRVRGKTTESETHR